MEKPNIGIIGFGFLGSAVAHGFGHCANLKIYDKYNDVYDSLEDTVKHSRYMFVGVPTPMKEDGSQDLSSCDDAVKSIIEVANSRKVIIIKTTVLPGTCREYAEKYPGHDFVHNPEFLTERRAKLEFINAPRIILGGEDHVTKEVEDLYRIRFTHTPIFRTTWEGAEVAKYMANCFYAVKVSFMNEMYDVAWHVGVRYDDLKDMLLASGWVNPMHTDVPGHDGERGYGGKCLVAGTKLITDKHEFINIENVTPGTKVFDGKEYTEVKGLTSRTVDETIKIVSNGRTIEGSNDHIHMVTKDFVNLEEKKLCDITKDDWLFVPPEQNTLGSICISMGKRPNGHVKVWHEHVMIDERLGRIIGLYLAEGCSGVYNGKASVYFSFGKHEERFADEVCETLSEYGLNPYKHLQISEGTFGESVCWIVRIRSIWLYKLFEILGLGHKAQDKDLDYTALGEHLAGSIIGGWLDGDGNYCAGTLEGYSESTNLIMKMDAILLANGINSNIDKDGRRLRVSTRAAVQRMCFWTNRFTFDATNYKTNIFYDSPNCKYMCGGWATKVKSAEKILGPKKVFAIETESGMYVANNILTHNCFPKDVKAFIHWAREHGLRSDLIEAADKMNERVRGKKDWLDIKGATSKNDYKTE